MFLQVLRITAIGILVGAGLFFIPFLFHVFFFFLVAGFLFRLLFGFRRRWGRYPDQGFRQDDMAGSFMNAHYYHKPGITPLYNKPEGRGPEQVIRVV